MAADSTTILPLMTRPAGAPTIRRNDWRALRKGAKRRDSAELTRGPPGSSRAKDSDCASLALIAPRARDRGVRRGRGSAGVFPQV